MLSLSGIAYCQRVSSVCNINEHLLALYKNDADRLAIRHVNHTGSPYKDSVRINEKISKQYLTALIAVHNATQLAARDTVVRFLDIHTYNPGLNTLVVIADSNLVWMTNLRYNRFPIRDHTIEQMMSTYSLKKSFYSGLLQPSMVVFKTDHNMNLAPLAVKMKSHVGVAAAEAEYLYGDGNDIRDSINDEFVELTYSFGWQDCPEGCVLRRYWKFRVFTDCSVEYSGSYGSYLEASILLNVLENESAFTDIRVYSNPVKSKVYLECPAMKGRKISVTLKNKKGNVVYFLKELKTPQEIDMLLFSNGVYQLELNDNNNKKVIKLTKQ